MSGAKIRALKTEVKKLEKRLYRIKSLLNARPLSRIFEIREKASEIVKAHKGDYEKMVKLIEPLAKEEKKMFVIANKKDSIKLLEKQFDIEIEIGKLQSEIYWVEKRMQE